MTRASNDHASARARVRLPVAVDPIRIGAEEGERPLSQVAEHVLDAIRARAVRRARGRLGRVVGAAEDGQLFFAMGYRVANADKVPEWKPGNEFKAIRDKSLK